MTTPVRFKRAADHDVESAFAWYEARVRGLGGEFLDELNAAVAGISSNPQSFPLVRGRIRRAVLHRFPYLLFYVANPHEIVVLACMHASRDPHRWPG